VTAEVEQVEDFDAFWQAQRAEQPRVRIRGVEVPIPMDLPLALVAQMHGATPADEEQNRRLLAELYGPEVIEQWISAGMGAREFFVVLTWSFVRGTGGTITFADAAVRADEVLAKMSDQGKAAAPKPTAPNRRARRSASAGASSSRTSAASTGSRRASSPA
jgi:hypothetical protein